MISKLHITAGYKNSSTYLKNSFYTQPFKIANVTEDRTGQLLQLMVMSSSPGVLDNDDYEINIELDEGAQLQLGTQGYQRLFDMKNGAKQILHACLRDNASFYYLPHPTVPHKGSRYYAINNIYLSNNHSLLWSEIVTCGRKLCNEKFEFTRFQNITNVFLGNNLVIRDNILLEPIKKNISVIGQFEGFTHQSALLYLNPQIDVEYLMQKCRKLLTVIEGIEFGISELPFKGFMVRMLGHRGEQLFELHNRLARLINGLLEVTTDLAATTI